MIRLLSAILIALMTLAPLAAAQEDNSTTTEPSRGKGDQAWVDDCPPDMMCAYGGSAEQEPGNESTDRPTYDGDCGGEVCAYDDAPHEDGEKTPGSRGPQDCEYCRGGEAPADHGSTCMDGQQDNETCRDDVQYMMPPKTDEGIPDGAVSKEETTAASDDAKTVPAGGLLAIVGLAAAALVVLARRH